MSNRTFPPAPSDKEAGSAWVKIMEMARRHCLVVQAYGGVAVLATPESQREQGERDKVLRMHQRREHGQQELAL